ncbi:hypothetical protein D3C73_1448130 [compost metagenome]
MIIQRDAEQIRYSRQNIHLAAQLILYTGRRNAGRGDHQRNVDQIPLVVFVAQDFLH